MPDIRLFVLFGALCASACAPIPNRDDPWLRADKAKHFGVSTAISAAAAQAYLNDNQSDCRAMRSAFAFTMAIGAGKEIYDSEVRRVGWSWRDLVADAAGALAGSALIAHCR